MKSKDVAIRAKADTRTQRGPILERELRAESEDRWDLGVERLDGFGSALVEIYEADAEYPIK